MLTTFFGNIDKRIKGLLDGKAPLMIAGVGYLLPIYQAVNTYPKLLPKAIVGNFDRTQLNDLQQLASALLLKVA